MNAPLNDLNAALKALQLKWTGTSPLWHDSVSRSFESQYLNPLVEDTRVTLKEMQILAQTIENAQQQVR